MKKTVFTFFFFLFFCVVFIHNSNADYDVPERALRLIEAGKFEEARNELNTFQRKQPGNPLVLFYLGQIEEDHNRALWYFKEVEILADSVLAAEALYRRAEIVFSDGIRSEAKELYEQAREAQHSAIEAAEAGEFEEALDAINESRDLAIEAVSLMKDEIQEDRAEIIERLREGIEETRALLDEVKAKLEETEDPDPRAVNLHRRGRIHLHRSIVALRERRLRNSGYHLRRANKYARIALHILTDDGTA